jgi:hypothetical protein
MAGFGYLPKSENVSHLTVTKTVVEKLDAPNVIEIVDGAEYNQTIGGAHLRYTVQASSVPATVTLPQAAVGMCFDIFVGMNPPFDSSRVSNGNNILTINAQNANNIIGYAANPDPSLASPDESIYIPIGTKTLTLDCGGSGNTIPAVNVIHSQLKFQCLE